MSKCCECKFGDFSYTAHKVPRIKHEVGRCLAVVPSPVLPMCVPRPILSKHGIWPETEGECPLFEVKQVVKS